MWVKWSLEQKIIISTTWGLEDFLYGRMKKRAVELSYCTTYIYIYIYNLYIISQDPVNLTMLSSNDFCQGWDYIQFFLSWEKLSDKHTLF